MLQFCWMQSDVSSVFYEPKLFCSCLVHLIIWRSSLFPFVIGVLIMKKVKGLIITGSCFNLCRAKLGRINCFKVWNLQRWAKVLIHVDGQAKWDSVRNCTSLSSSFINTQSGKSNYPPPSCGLFPLAFSEDIFSTTWLCLQKSQFTTVLLMYLLILPKYTK